MAAERVPEFITPQEYLALERAASVKSEYISGHMYAMAGGSEAHNTVTVNLSTALNIRLRDKDCRVYSADLRVKVDETGLYTYPNVIAICGEREFLDNKRDTLLNPTVIFEVLSPSTSNYDRGEKFAHYRRIPSLSDYLLVAQDRYRVEHYVRQAEGSWLFSEVDGPDSVLHLNTIDCHLPLSEIYAKLEMPPLPVQSGGDLLPPAT